MTESLDVVIVGAGLAGLACARELTGRGLDVVLLEGSDAVGGRVRSDLVDGFTLDRGFQVLNTGYPELPRFVDLDSLDLRPFDASVRVLVDGELVTVGNPLQKPSSLPTLFGLPMGGLAGQAATGLYAGKCLVLPTPRLKRRSDVSAAEAWRRAGIPPDVVNGILRPFFSGVVLEQGMTTSRRFTDLMIRMFALGRSTVPAGGMQQLPERIAEALPADTVRLSSPVRRLDSRSVQTVHGRISARAVVVATDPWTARTLLSDRIPLPEPRGVTTVYHSAPDFPEASAALLLDADRSPLANTIALSKAAPEYAPPGRVLVSTSMVHGSVPDDVDGPEVRAALSALHRTDTSGWEHIATYDLPRALPGMRAPHPLRKPVRLSHGTDTVYVAGDHRDTSSLQGALVSGRRAAETVLADLGVAPPA
jgi:phytoene dehydrogenase-like protein